MSALTGEAQDDALPLRGIVVLDFSLLLPGPFCTQMLADLGATVLKVEPPAGDPARSMSSDLFWVANRNKRSVVVDVRQPAGARLCLELAREADVLVEGFRPGRMARLGLGPDAVRAANPRIVYCSISGFGQTGPLRDAPGHEANYMASAGALSFSGHWGEPPRRSGIPTTDLGTGAIAALSIVAALHRRDQSGLGAYLDLGLRDVAMYLASTRAGRNFRLEGDEQSHLWPTSDLFPAADGVVLALGVVEQRFWDRLVSALSTDAPEIASARFSDEAGRRAHGNELKALLARVFASQSAAYWLERLQPLDVPIQPVQRFSEAARDEQTASRGLVAEADGSRFIAFPALIDGHPVPVLREPPALGEATREVLREVLGVAADAIDDMVEQGVVQERR